MKGGLRQKNTDISTWEAVYKMMGVKGATLDVITYTSLKGFIFKLEVPNNLENSEFYGINEDRRGMNSPVFSLVFKFAIINNYGNTRFPDIISNKGIQHPKTSEKFDDFKIEANSQQKIYTDTISPSGKPITISVVDLSFFNKSSAHSLLKELINIPTTDPNKKGEQEYVLQYINTNLQNGLGLITMELIHETFKPLLYCSELNQARGEIYALSQLIILFVKSRLINYDCHMKNIMGNDSPDTNHIEEKSVLIDFGNTINVDNIPQNIITKYNSVFGNFTNDYDTIKNLDITDLYITYLATQGLIINRMENIIKFISRIDYCKNALKYNKTCPQMIHLIMDLYPTVNNDWTKPIIWDKFATGRTMIVYDSIIKIIYTITHDELRPVNRFSKKNIETSIRKGEIPFFVDPDNSVYDRSTYFSSIVTRTPTAAAAAQTTFHTRDINEIVAPSANRMDRNSNGEETLLDIAKDCVGKLCPMLRTRKLKVDGGKKRKIKKRNTKKLKKYDVKNKNGYKKNIL